MKSNINEALKNHQLSDLSYDKNAGIAKATFVDDLTSSEKSSLKEIITDIFGVKPGWVGHKGVVLNIPEEEFNNFQKLMILDLQLIMADEMEVANEAEDDEMDKSGFVSVMESFSSVLKKSIITEGKSDKIQFMGRNEAEVDFAKEAFDSFGEDFWLDKTVDDFDFESDEDEETGEIVWSVNYDNNFIGIGGESEEEAREALKKALVTMKGIKEAKDADDNDIAEGDEVLVVGHVQHEGKKGVVVETSDSSDFVIVEIKGKNYSYHASDLRKVEEEEEEEYDYDTQNIYDYIIDIDERDEFKAHVEDIDGEVVYEIDGIDDLMSLIDDGFMKHKGDTDGLLKHLQDVGILDQDAILEGIDHKISKFIAKIDENFGDDDALALDNSEPEYEVIVEPDGPIETQRVAKIAQKFDIDGRPDTGFIIASKTLLRKFINTLRGFEIAVTRILDGHNNEVALASVAEYKPKGRPTNKYNYPNRMRESRISEAYTFDQAKADFESDGRVHFHGSDKNEMKVFHAMVEYLKKQGIEYGETNVTPEQYTLYNAEMFDSSLRRIKK